MQRVTWKFRKFCLFLARRTLSERLVLNGHLEYLQKKGRRWRFANIVTLLRYLVVCLFASNSALQTSLLKVPLPLLSEVTPGFFVFFDRITNWFDVFQRAREKINQRFAPFNYWTEEKHLSLQKISPLEQEQNQAKRSRFSTGWTIPGLPRIAYAVNKAEASEPR